MSWASDLTTNALKSTYINNCLDVSGGSVTIRNAAYNLITGTGDVSLNGTTTFNQPFTYNTDLSLNRRLFVLGDVSMVSGRLYVGSNATITGKLSAGSYKAGSISLSAINSGGGGGGFTVNTADTTFTVDMSYNAPIKLNGDVSLNSTAQFTAANSLTVRNKIQFSDLTAISTSSRGPNGVTFKDSSFNNMTVTGAFSSPSAVVVTSDYRIKSNVQTLDETHILDKLRPVAYYQTQTECNDIGFIAHELQDQYPELVDGVKDGEKMQSVDYNGILALLINEVQRLKQFVEEAKADIAVQAVQEI